MINDCEIIIAYWQESERGVSELEKQLEIWGSGSSETPVKVYNFYCHLSL